MRSLKRLILLIVALSFALSLSACAGGPAVNNNLPVFSDRDATNFDRTVYRKNDLTLQMENPHVIYADQGVGEGYYILYGDKTEAGAGAISVFKSKNLSDWTAAGVAFAPLRTSWVKGDCFSPMVIYDDAEKLYYMYYSALGNTTERQASGIGVAVSVSPYGPFTEFEGVDSDGRWIKAEEQTIDINRPLSLPDNIRPQMRDPYLFTTQDAMYLYFSDGRDIWVVEMADYVTPRFATLKKVTEYAKTEVNGAAFDADRDDLSVSPSVIRLGNKYALTYSTGKGENHAVCYAYSDSPAGGFTKQGALLEVPYNVGANGGHSIIEEGGKYAIAYSAADEDRAGVCFDRVTAAERLQATATRSLMPALLCDNLAKSAKVAESDGVGFAALTDNDPSTSVSLASDSRTVTFVFADYVSLNALFVEADAGMIDKIVLRTDKTNLDAFNGYAFDGTVVINGPAFNGGAAFAQFVRLNVREVRFEFSSESQCRIADIYLLSSAV